MADRIAAACQIDLPNGLRIWVPPTGRPYWVGKLAGKAGPDLTDQELVEHGLVHSVHKRTSLV